VDVFLCFLGGSLTFMSMDLKRTYVPNEFVFISSAPGTQKERNSSLLNLRFHIAAECAAVKSP
jgi:hypothetical protein